MKTVCRFCLFGVVRLDPPAELTFIILANETPVSSKGTTEDTDTDWLNKLPMVGDVNLFLKGDPSDDDFEAEVEIMIAGASHRFSHDEQGMPTNRQLQSPPTADAASHTPSSSSSSPTRPPPPHPRPPTRTHQASRASRAPAWSRGSACRTRRASRSSRSSASSRRGAWRSSASSRCAGGRALAGSGSAGRCWRGCGSPMSEGYRAGCCR